MVKVALCGNIQMEVGSVSGALERCAQTAGAQPLSVAEYSNPIDFVDACTNIADGQPFDLVVSATDLPGITGLQMAQELQRLYQLSGGLPMVLCATDEQDAFEAYACGVRGYLVQPVTDAGFDATVGRLLAQAVRVQSESMVVRCREGVRRVLFPKLEYVMTEGHDQALHLLGESNPCVLRSSSSSMFQMLEADGRFFKVGSSYIINMDLVRSFSMRSGLVLLSSGFQVPVPVRARKSLAEALCARSAMAF